MLNGRLRCRRHNKVIIVVQPSDESGVSEDYTRVQFLFTLICGFSFNEFLVFLS